MLQEVCDRSTAIEALRKAGKFLTLDTKILSALSRVAKGELTRQTINYKESEASVGRAVRGRQVLLIFEHFFKTNEETRSVCSVQDLRLKIAGINHQPEETALRDIRLRELCN